MIDYSQGKIYKLVCDDGFYIGSTCRALKIRLGEHKRHRTGYRKTTASALTINENTYIELIMDYPCNNKYQLEQIEGQIIMQNPDCVNKVVPKLNYNPMRWGNKLTTCELCECILTNGSMTKHMDRKHSI